jgi:integrase
MRYRLTEAFLKRIKPGTERVEYSDTIEPGLMLRIGPGGVKWSCIYRIKGDRKLFREQLGTYPSTSLADARQKTKEIRATAGKGTSPRGGSGDGMKVSKLLDEYESHPATQKMKSIDEHMRVLRKDLKRWEGKRVTDIKRRDVVLLVDEIRPRGERIANVFQGNLVKLLGFAADRGIIDANPIAGLKKTVEHPRDRVLSDDEIRTFWHALPDHDLTPATVNALRLILVTGQRPGEVVGMKWSEVDGDTWTLPPARRKKIRGEKMKPHVVPLSALAQQVLDDADNHGKYAFPGKQGRKGAGVDPATLSRALLRKLPDMKLDPFTPHDLRRTCRTRLAGLGIAPHVAEKVLGHKLGGMLAVYDQHDYLDERRQALDLWGKSLEKILEGKRHD